jgi:hypothetical protein
MTDTWYKTTSTDGYTLDDPVATNTPPNSNFTPYNIPAIWSNFLTNSKDILIDSTTANSSKQVFMSKNIQKLVNLIHTWNCSVEATVDYIDWD